MVKYSKLTKQFKDKVKKIKLSYTDNGKFNKDYFSKAYDEKIKKLSESELHDEMNQGIVYEMFMYRNIILHEYINLYIESEELVLFLSETKIKDFDGLEEFLTEFGNPVAFSCIIHLPEEKDSVVVVCLYVEDKITIIIDYKDKIMIRSAENIESYFYDKMEDSKYVARKRIKTIVLNTFKYMQCFPETITKLPPSSYKDEFYSRGVVKINTASEIKESLTKEMMPHLRKGYFKYLGSDFYTKKKGTTVYVHPTFVNKNSCTLNNVGNKTK